MTDTPTGVYAHFPGVDGQVYVRTAAPPYAELLSAALESLRRHEATDPRSAGVMRRLSTATAESLAGELGDLDPDVVCRVALSVLGKTGGMLAVTGHAALAFNVVGLAAIQNAGHLPARAEGGAA